MNDPLKIFVIAGEASGDSLGQAFLRDLKKTHPDAEIKGVGSTLMEGEGLSSLFPMEELSLMGIFEILPHIPNLLKRIKQTVAAIKEFEPDLVVTIDAPDFCFRVVKQLRSKGYDQSKFLHYVAPTVWAWREGRAKKVASLYDGILCLLPFEPPYFEKEGLDAHFVGHPVLGSDLSRGDDNNFRKDNDLEGVETLGLFLGSRKGELKRTGLELILAAKEWLSAQENRKIIVPTLPHMVPYVEEALSAIARDKMIITADKDLRPDAFAAIDKAVAVSGTIGLELSICDIPHIVAYKANWMTYQILKRLVNVEYAHLTNILLDKPVVPEFLQDDCYRPNVVYSIENLDVKAQKKAFNDVKDLLKSDKNAYQAALSLLPLR